MPPQSEHVLSALRRMDFFAGLDEGDLAALAAIGRVQEMGGGQFLFQQGDPGDALYVVLTGGVTVQAAAEDGRTVQLNRLAAGSVLGEIALIDGGPRTATVTAEAASTIFALPRQPFLAFLETRPRLSQKLLELLCQRLRHIASSAEDSMFLSVPQRVASRIVALAPEGETCDDGIRMAVPAQDQMARSVGATREAVNRALQVLKRNGLITYDRRTLLITDVQGLRAFAKPARRSP